MEVRTRRCSPVPAGTSAPGRRPTHRRLGVGCPVLLPRGGTHHAAASAAWRADVARATSALHSTVRRRGGQGVTVIGLPLLTSFQSRLEKVAGSMTLLAVAQSMSSWRISIWRL